MDIDQKTYEFLVAKLDPRRFTGMSGKMAAIIGFVLDQQFTSPEMKSLSLTSDGYVVTIDSFLGTASELQGNLNRLFDVAELTEAERVVFRTMWHDRVDNPNGIKV